MNDNGITTLDQVRRFLEGTEVVDFAIKDKQARYAWIQKTLVRFRYRELNKQDKGLISRYLVKVSGYSRQQTTRLVTQYRTTGRVRRRQRTVTGFKRKYTQVDIRLLAELDELHGTLSGPATKKLCERAYGLFGEKKYRRLAGISISHLYNLRRSTAYTRSRLTFNKTRPAHSSLGERRKPQPNGQPGFIRVDTVHQGDREGAKGVYHINAVDAVTQFEIVASSERISEHYLLPILEELLENFPFYVKGFHTDNGSEYINKRVARLLNKLLIELTKSRARQTNDNALVESKNGSVVRKHLGYAHIPQRWAPVINTFNRNFLNPYINFHRPCFFPVTLTDSQGKERKIYPYDKMMTPYEKLKSLAHAESYLKPGTHFKQLDEIAYGISDDEAARQMNEARQQLFKAITEQERVA